MSRGDSLGFDMANVGRWDSGLIAFLWDVRRAAADAGMTIDTNSLPASARTLLGLLPDQPAAAPPPRRRGFNPLASLGAATIDTVTEVGVLSSLLAAAARGSLRALAGRARMRGVDLLGNISDAGPSALVIVSVVNFLIGAILAFVGSPRCRATRKSTP
jgi:phospholipid/cholesterol/gamma-HCH transport system permease protein